MKVRYSIVSFYPYEGEVYFDKNYSTQREIYFKNYFYQREISSKNYLNQREIYFQKITLNSEKFTSKITSAAKKLLQYSNVGDLHLNSKFNVNLM